MSKFGNEQQFSAGLREDFIHHVPLLDCLVELTRFYGRSSTRAALAAGLPCQSWA